MAWPLRSLASLLGLALLLGATLTGGGDRAGRHDEVGCGGERWGVKTLSDRRRAWVDLEHVHPATVRSLRRRVPPSLTRDDTPRRRGVETTLFRVRARAVQMKREADLDVHLVIRRLFRPGTMIVELPSRHCLSTRTRARRGIAGARRSLVAAFGRPTSHWKLLQGVVTITGVGFFDELHGQTGVAPNGIELHPLVRFRAVGTAAASATGAGARAASSACRAVRDPGWSRRACSAPSAAGS